MRRLFACSAAILLLVAPTAQSQLIVYEGFNYTGGSSLSGQSGGGSFGFGAPWATASGPVTIQAGSLTSGSLITSGNRVTASGGLGGSDTRNLSPTTFGANGTVVWISVLMQGLGVSATTSQGVVALTDGASGGFGIVTGTISGSPNYAVSDVGTGSTNSASGTLSNQLALLVVRATFGATDPTPDVFDLFVNPPLGVTPTTPSATMNLVTPSNLNTLRIIGTGTGGSYQFDEIRIGNSFADVTPVPEPSTMLLAGVAGMSGWLMRRKHASSKRR